MSLWSAPTPALYSPHDSGKKIAINYPTRASFLRYLNKLEAPKSAGNRLLLDKRPAPKYMLENCPKYNIFKLTKNDPTKELKRQASEKKIAERVRCTQFGNVFKKVPKNYRQPFTAVNELKEFVHYENITEIYTHGRLFGPQRLTFQPRNKHNVPLFQKKKSIKVESPESLESGSKNERKSSGESLRSKSTESDSTTSSYTESFSDKGVFSVNRSSLQTISGNKTSVWVADRYHDNFSKTRAFIEDRKNICLMNLSTQINEEEIARLTNRLKEESDYLALAEGELTGQREDHDRFIQELTLRTTESIKRAEEANSKRVYRMDMLKRFTHRINAMEAEYIKLEDEYKRLKTYKDFLDSVAKNVEAKRESTRMAALKLSLISEEKKEKEDQEIEKTQNYEVISDIFETPLDFIDLLTELESDNLTLIESIQEQDEVLELLRFKIKKAQRLLDAQKSTWDEYISRQEDINSDLLKRAADIESARNQIKTFSQLKRYEGFSLGSLDQFDPPWLKDGKVAKKLDKVVDKTTIDQLLDVLQKQINKIYCKVFRKEKSTKLGIIVMLKNLESTMDDLDKRQLKYDRMAVLKAKKVVDEYNRAVAREHRRAIEEMTNEIRRKKAFERSSEPPKYHRGRRVIERSLPPACKRRVQKVAKEETSADAGDKDAYLFK
nr:coiled coil domain containing protein 37 [Hymenolepis microstoma]